MAHSIGLVNYGASMHAWVLDLRRPIYKKTAAFGHFGRTEPEFTWEKTDKAAALRADGGR